MNDASLHNHTRTFLFWVSAQLVLNIVKEHFRKVTEFINRWPRTLGSERIIVPGELILLTSLDVICGLLRGSECFAFFLLCGLIFLSTKEAREVVTDS